MGCVVLSQREEAAALLLLRQMVVTARRLLSIPSAAIDEDHDAEFKQHAARLVALVDHGAKFLGGGR